MSQKITEVANRIFHHNISVTNFVTSLFMGGGLCYTFEQKKYWHIPLVVLFPSVYTGYHLFKNHDKIITGISDSMQSGIHK
jgi:hypothetical protein